MSSTVSTANVSQLLHNAKDEGLVSQAAAAVLEVPDLNAQIQAGLGTPPEDVDASETLVVGMIIDNSGSIDGITDGPEAVCEGQNAVIDALNESKQTNGILVGTWLIDADSPVHPFVKLDQCVRLEDGKNYAAVGGTPLYRRMVAVLGTVLAKMQEFAEAGVMCRGVLMVVTDGYDEDYGPASRRLTAKDCKRLIDDLNENMIVLFMGIQDADPHRRSVNFYEIAEEMGIPERNVMTPDNTKSEIRKAFAVASQSALRASQGAAGFSQVKAAGGFGV
jgi:hypothetical protein